MGVDPLIAIIMAGGKATRFHRHVEKGVLRVGDLTLLERSLRALSAGKVDRAVVASSPHTPETGRAAEELGAEVVDTSGLSYHDDIVELLDLHDRFLSLNVDVPFVNGGHVSRILEAYEGTSVAAVVRSEASLMAPERGSVGTGPDGRANIWVGLNIVTPDPETALLEFDDPLLSVNINDDDDLALADRMARERRL